MIYTLIWKIWWHKKMRIQYKNLDWMRVNWGIRLHSYCTGVYCDVRVNMCESPINHTWMWRRQVSWVCIEAWSSNQVRNTSQNMANCYMAVSRWLIKNLQPGYELHMPKFKLDSRYVRYAWIEWFFWNHCSHFRLFFESDGGNTWDSGIVYLDVGVIWELCHQLKWDIVKSDHLCGY